MSRITTHILDTAEGHPAKGMHVSLDIHRDGGWVPLSEGDANAVGRVSNLLPPHAEVETGRYRIHFETGTYFAQSNRPCFYPRVTVEFEINAGDRHYHVPLLISGYGYSTYRGS